MSTVSTENVVKVVKMFLNSHHMPAYESWISGCVDYFLENSQSLADIKNNAYQQWLLNHLQYISPGSLPQNICELNKVELNGNFVLQINSAIDISTPKYQQYLKIKKTDTQNIEATMNAEEKISSKRMLKFELTDGKQIIAGMEYGTIQARTEDIIPGCKALIKGPVSCRLGMMLLTNKNMVLLGGEVQNMIETHSLIAQLASTLNLPLIDKSSEDSTQLTLTRSDVTSHTSNRTLNTQNTSRSNNDTNSEVFSSHQRVQYSNTGQNRHNGNHNTTEADSCSSGKRQSDSTTAPEKRMKFEEEMYIDERDWGKFEDDIRVIEEVEKLHRSIMEDDDEHFAEEDLKQIEECEQLYSGNSQTVPTVSTEPFVYIKQIKELSESERNSKVFKVKAQIQNVLTKLTMTPKREWNLKCTIVDGTGSMDVEFASDILSDFLGYTPESISEIKKKVASNPGIKNEINSAYVKTAEALRTLYCIMELRMPMMNTEQPTADCLPKITRVIDYDTTHVDLLKKRLENITLKPS